MAIVECYADDGHLLEVSEVTLAKDGTHIHITDDEGRFIAVHRSAWAQLVHGVNIMLEKALQDGKKRTV